MPEIHPFRALLYNVDRIGRDLSKVVAQPYDKVDDKLQQEYYDRHPNHIVRLDKRKDEPGDKYEGAAQTLNEWIRQGVLVQDAKPAFYAFHQTYKVDGAKRTRKGITAMVKIEVPGEGKIHPHEETHAGPKIDRLKLVRATGVHFGHIFLLYPDPKMAIDRLIDRATRGKPDLRAVDDFGEEHRVWRIDDPATVKTVAALMKARDAIIADGHHRYETAVAFRDECRAAGKKCEGTESFENVMATLVNMDDEGLACFGTHRVIRDKRPIVAKDFLGGLASRFDVKEFPFSNAAREKKARATLIKELRKQGAKQPTFGLALPSTCHALFKVRDVKKVAAQIREPRSMEWRSLDNNILHTIVLDGMLGITPDDTAHERFVDYVRSADEAVERVLSRKAICAFLVNPVTMEQIRKVVKKGERFPQKSTDFYPKIISGMIMGRLNFVS